MGKERKRSSFAGSLGFVMAAAGSAVGLGNIWRFPYLAAKDGGGVFLLCYIILALTFGFTMLTTEIAIGRKTAQSPLTAYGMIHKKWGGIGILACLVPTIILPYYCAIGGWVTKYCFTYLTGNGAASAEDGYFTNFISMEGEPIIWLLIYLGATVFVVFCGVNKGIEKYSKILMPILVVLILVISIYSLTLSHTDANGITRTGLEGLKIYVIPDFTGMTIKRFFIILMDAMGQLFYSVSVAMGIMVAYGSYVKKETNLNKSINQIEFFDTLVAFLAGLMIIPAVYTFAGTEGMSAGPGLMFVSLPKIFTAMGTFGNIIGTLFFVMVLFAALTSSISLFETIVSIMMEKFHWSRIKTCVIAFIISVALGIPSALGYGVLDSVRIIGMQFLDFFDFISNSVIMPIVAFFTCIFVGYIIKPKAIHDEVTESGKFSRYGMYQVMVKYVAPPLLVLILVSAILNTFGIISL